MLQAIAHPPAVPMMMRGVALAGPVSEAGGLIWGLVSAASAGASAYHGYKRNDSVGWGIAWALLGGLFPVVTPAIAVAQGFGKRKR